MKTPKAHWDPSRRKWAAKGINPDTGARRSFYADSEAEASRLAAASLGLSEAEADTETLYGFYATCYLPTVAHRSDSWKYQIGWAMDGYVLPLFGDRRLGEIERTEVQKAFNQWSRKLKGSLPKLRIVFSAVMNLAEDDGLIARNPVRKVRLAPAPPPNKKALTFEQLAALLKACPPQLLPPVLLMAFGLRLGEACAVRRADVAEGEIRVRRQILQPRGGAKDSDVLKTPQSRRDIPVPTSVTAALREAGQVSGVWISSSGSGGFLLPNNVQRDLDALLQSEIRNPKSAIPRVTPHELRHTFISLMENEIEAPPAIVAALAGRKYSGPNAGYSHTFRTQLLRWTSRYWTEIEKTDVGPNWGQSLSPNRLIRRFPANLTAFLVPRRGPVYLLGFAK